MLNAVLRRLAAAPLVLLVLVAVTFALIHAAPGDPFVGERAADPQAVAALRKQYRLDRPLPEQFAVYVGNLACGDFGPSLRNRGQAVGGIIADRLPTSLWLGALALTLALGTGLALGILGAVRAGRALDHGLALVAIVGVSIPVFVIGPALAWTFGLRLGWLPVGQWAGFFGVAHLVLPATTLAIPFAARVARLTRAGLLDTLHLDHVRTATAKGVAPATVVVRHALPLGLVPVIAFLGPASAGLLTGSLVVEKVFQIPGLGQEFVESAFTRDYPLVLGTVVVYGALIIVGNLVADLLVVAVDPRVRDGKTR